MILFQSYYNPKNKDRKKEIEYCLKRNLENPSIEKIVLFIDNENVKYPKHEKIEVFGLESQHLTFAEVFTYACKLHKDSICCLINNDIFLDHEAFSNMSEIQNLVENNVVLSLSRHEYNIHTKISERDENFARLLFAHTQDAWVWKADFVPKDSNFNVGTLGSDNAINHRLRESERIPINLGAKYKVHHVDAVRGKNSKNFLNKDFRPEERETYPEESGQLLAPDYVALQEQSLDSFANQLQLNHIDKYRIMCEMMTMKVKIKNR